MQLSVIRSEVSDIIQDESFSGDDIDSLINECLVLAAALVDLPDLKRLDTVNTSITVPYKTLTGLTGGFSGRLKRVNRSGSGPITIFPNLEVLMDEYVTASYPALTEAGSVEAVALEGRILWYQYVPASAQTLTILYYRNPTSLSGDSAVPSELPDNTHRGLLVNGACKLAFDKIEDGLEESEKVNTRHYHYHSFEEKNPKSGITLLREWVSKSRVNKKSGVWRY